MAKKKKATGGIMGRLGKLQKEWKKAEPRRGGAPVPDDNYSARIESAVLEESQQTERLQIHWTLVIQDEDYEGKKLHKYDGINEERDLEWIQGTLEALELDIPDDITTIGEVLEETQGLLVSITVSTKDEFTNVYFNELLEDDEDADEDADADADNTDEDIEVGSLVVATIDDEDYNGEVIKLTKDGQATVKFDDGDTDTFDVDDLEFQEGAEEGGATEDDINGMKKSELIELIEEEDIDLDADDYEKIADLKEAIIEELFE